jgi:CheY-like chemotaxis protein
MDVQMPKVDGFEATRHIRNMEETIGTHIPIIAMTAHAMKGDREKCLESGMDYYITKPVDSKELIELIQKVISV